MYDMLPFVETCLISTFGLGGPDCFNANLSEFDSRLKGTSFKDTTELHGTDVICKVCDLIEDAPSLSFSVTYDASALGRTLPEPIEKPY